MLFFKKFFPFLQWLHFEPFILKHGGRDKIVAILEKTFLNSFFLNENYCCILNKIAWDLYPRVQLKTMSCGSDNGLAPRQAIFWPMMGQCSITYICETKGRWTIENARNNLNINAQLLWLQVNVPPFIIRYWTLSDQQELQIFFKTQQTYPNIPISTLSHSLWVIFVKKGEQNNNNFKQWWKRFHDGKWVR